MPLLEVQGIADDQVRRGLDTLNTFGEGGFYRPAHPVPMVPSGSAVWERPTIGGSLRDIAAIRFPDTTARITGSFPLPPGWITGSVALEVEYTGSTSSTANCVIAASVTPCALGAALPSASAPSVTTPGPATAGFLLVFTSALFGVTAAARTCCFKLAQIAQTYAGQVYILGVYPVFYPRKG